MALTPEDKENEANDRIRSYLKDLYGSEEMLIVRNTTNGIVSVGFGELGDKGGLPGGIPRSKLPIVLTDHFPRDAWIKSPDFRRAVAKGWLVPVSSAEYEKEVDANRQRLAALKALTAKDAAPSAPVQHANPLAEDPSGAPMVIDEDSASLVPAAQDKRTQQFLNYENGMETSPAPESNAHVAVQGQNINSRAIAFCEDQRRGSVTSVQAIELLDDLDKVFTAEDLNYIVANSSFESVKSVARRCLADRG